MNRRQALALPIGLALTVVATLASYRYFLPLWVPLLRWESGVGDWRGLALRARPTSDRRERYHQYTTDGRYVLVMDAHGGNVRKKQPAPGLYTAAGKLLWRVHWFEQEERRLVLFDDAHHILRIGDGVLISYRDGEENGRVLIDQLYSLAAGRRGLGYYRLRFRPDSPRVELVSGSNWYLFDLTDGQLHRPLYGDLLALVVALVGLGLTLTATVRARGDGPALTWADLVFGTSALVAGAALVALT